MMILHLVIPGALPGKGRPRFDPRSRRAYTDKATVKAEERVRMTAQATLGAPRLEGALRVVLELGVPVPKSWPAAKRQAALTGALRPTAKPDVDNVSKLVLDALNDVLWVDDAQVCELHVRRVFMRDPKTTLAVVALDSVTEGGMLS